MFMGFIPFDSIIEVEDASVLDEFYWLDHDDPNSSNCRIIHDRGQRAADDGEFTLSAAAQKSWSNYL